MKKLFEKSMEEALWVCKSLFDRNKVSGNSANISFRFVDNIYVSASGASFGTIVKEDFSVISMDGQPLAGRNPSKEYPLHLAFYRKDESIQSVIHTHSFYSTLWSCLEHDNLQDCIPEYTPYLKMKLGTVGIIEYFPPGSKELFSALEKNIHCSNGFLLGNHGAIVGGKSIMDAFSIIEELEESCRVTWAFEGKYKKVKKIMSLKN